MRVPLVRNIVHATACRDLVARLSCGFQRTDWREEFEFYDTGTSGSYSWNL